MWLSGIVHSNKTPQPFVSENLQDVQGGGQVQDTWVRQLSPLHAGPCRPQNLLVRASFGIVGSFVFGLLSRGTLHALCPFFQGEPKRKEEKPIPFQDDAGPSSNPHL